LFQPSKVYYHHLKKCGGTSLNLWLDSQFPAYGDSFREVQIAAYSSFAEEQNHSIRERKRKQAFANTIMAERDLVHDHSALACLVPQGTFRFTVLRSPLDRLLSQVSDFRKLKPHNYAHHPPAIRQVHTDINIMPLGEYFEKHALENGPFRHFFDNYMVRAIAHNRVGVLCNDHADASIFLPIAIETLDKDFEFVGLLEEDRMTRTLLAASLGWAPVSNWPILNRRGLDAALQKEVDEAGDILTRLTEWDQKLYDHARFLFQQYRQSFGDFSDVDFETDFASKRLRDLKAKFTETGMMYDMSQPITGSGHLGRRAGQDGRPWVWTDSAQTFVLYAPVPAGTATTVFLRILEYSDDGFRDALSLSIDGTPVRHTLSNAPDCKDLLTAECRTTRDFVRLELTIDPEIAKNAAHPRGLRIDAYGWQ
jgi:hypothetical protein